MRYWFMWLAWEKTTSTCEEDLNGIADLSRLAVTCHIPGLRLQLTTTVCNMVKSHDSEYLFWSN